MSGGHETSIYILSRILPFVGRFLYINYRYQQSIFCQVGHFEFVLKILHFCYLTLLRSAIKFFDRFALSIRNFEIVYNSYCLILLKLENAILGCFHSIPYITENSIFGQVGHFNFTSASSCRNLSHLGVMAPGTAEH